VDALDDVIARSNGRHGPAIRCCRSPTAS
jgi:hypothetical protein